MPSALAKKASTIDTKCLSSSVRRAQSSASRVRSTSPATHIAASACLYASQMRG